MVSLNRVSNLIIFFVIFEYLLLGLVKADTRFFKTPLSNINAAYPTQGSERQFVYRAIIGGYLHGRGAKYVIAGRIINNQECNIDRFMINAALKLQNKALNDPKATMALNQGMGDAISLDQLPHYCEVLYYDAANWKLAYPLTATSDVLQRIKMLSAVESNDCNWDDEAQEIIEKFQHLNDRSSYISSIERTMLMTVYSTNKDANNLAEEEGYALGTSGNKNFQAECNTINNFASKLDW